MNKLVLFSGGMDSCIAYFDALHRSTKDGGIVHAIMFDYGQRHVQELTAARDVWRMAEARYFNHMGLMRRIPITKRFVIPEVGSLMNPAIGIKTEGHDQGEDPSFIPHRNLLFMVIAAMWARQWNCEQVVTGIRGGFSDCSEKFERLVELTVSESDPTFKLSFYSPVHVSRADSLLLAAKIPGCWDALGYTLTCFKGTPEPCGKCLPCTKRAEGFAQIGCADPLVQRFRLA